MPSPTHPNATKPTSTPHRALMLLALLALSVLTLSARAPVIRAQDATPTLIITQPTPLATPDPFAPAPASPLTMHAGEGVVMENAYQVREGDTLLTVALEMGLDVDQMGCVLRPDFDVAQPLVVGDLLPALPAGTVCHRTAPEVAASETVRELATLYGVSSASILGEAWNALPQDEYLVLPAGRYVRIPQASGAALDITFATSSAPIADGASPFLAWMLAQPSTVTPQQALGYGGARRVQSMAPVPADWPYGTGNFVWPTYGFLTQGYRSDHRALDIAAPAGSPITAADRGVVLRAGWNNQGYGYFVIVDHNIDYMTLYAHMATIFVEEGEVVAAGQILGTVGSSGNSTGPHLHFEIRDFGRLANPLEYLAR